MYRGIQRVYQRVYQCITHSEIAGQESGQKDPELFHYLSGLVRREHIVHDMGDQDDGHRREHDSRNITWMPFAG